MFSSSCGWRPSPEQWRTLHCVGASISESIAKQIELLERSSQDSLEPGVQALIMIIYLTSSAANLQFVHLESRRMTYHLDTLPTWNGKVPWEILAESGFYRSDDGGPDNVKCFFCNVGLQDWDENDDPVAEHAKHSPLCFFVKSSNGLDFIRAMNPSFPERRIPRSFTRYDHLGLLKILADKMQEKCIQDALSKGYNETSVLLLVARRHIRDRIYFGSLEEIAVGLDYFNDSSKLGAAAAVVDDGDSKLKALREVCHFTTAMLGADYDNISTCFNCYVEEMRTLEAAVF